MSKKVVVARKAGFCPGVERAFQKALQALEEKQEPVFLFGELVHNRQVMEFLIDKGARVVNNLLDVPPGVTVVTRSHGIKKEDFEVLKSKGAKIVDTTCPRVRKARFLAQRMQRENEGLIVLGDYKHPEVEALLSYINSEVVVCSKNPEEWENVAGWLEKRRFVGLVEQTTLPRSVVDTFRAWFRKRFPDVKLQVAYTLCPETEERQQELLDVIRTKKIDAVIVVGGKNSANTRALFLLARQEGVRVFWVETAEELSSLPQLEGEILLVSGASTPRTIVEEVERSLQTEAGEQNGRI